MEKGEASGRNSKQKMRKERYDTHKYGKVETWGEGDVGRLPARFSGGVVSRNPIGKPSSEKVGKGCCRGTDLRNVRKRS